MRSKLIQFLEALNKDLNGTLLRTNIPEYVDKIIMYATLETISEHGRIKAFIAFYENDEDKELAYLTMIAVHKDHWQLGYGKKLLESSINQIKNKGFKRYRLQVKKDNLKAIKLYEDYGFVRVGEALGLIDMEKQL